MKMNDSSITFNETEGKENVESSTWQLTVVVIVLGTLVGMVVVVVGVWLCVACSRRGGRPGKRSWREQESMFPPPQRELVELGRLPTSSHRRSNLQPDSNNYSGISSGLGLGTSYPVEQIPSLPSPQSWTPSPPFDPQQIQVLPQRVHVLHPENEPNPAVVRGANGMGMDVGSALYGSRARTSPYNPRYNTLATDYTGAPGFRTQSGYHIQGVYPDQRTRKRKTREQWETFSDNYEGKHSSPECKTHRRLLRHQNHRINELGEGRRTPRNSRIYLQDPFENTNDLLEEGSTSEPPDACSSRHGTTHSHHHTPQISRSENLLDPSRARPFHDFTSDLLQDFRAGSDVDNGYWQEDHNAHVRLKQSTRPRLQREGKVRPKPPTLRPHWMKHYQARANHGLWQHQGQPCHCHSPHTPPYNQQVSYSELERVVPRSLALKYGFCPTCGVQRSTKKMPRNPSCVPYGHQLKSRYTQIEREEELDSLNSNDDLAHDATPSMSWDNLTPDPSPVLTSTLEDSRALGTEAVATAADDDKEVCNDVSGHASAHQDCFRAEAITFGVTYTDESSYSDGAS